MLDQERADLCGCLIDVCCEHGVDTEMHTNKPIMVRRWFREHCAAMPYRVAYHLHDPRQIKQITGSAWPSKRAAFVVTKDAASALIDHIVAMIEATPA